MQDKDININLQNDAGITALHYAASRLEYKFVKLLLQYNADPFIHDNNGKTALDLLVEVDDKNEIKVILIAAMKLKLALVPAL